MDQRNNFESLLSWCKEVGNVCIMLAICTAAAKVSIFYSFSENVNELSALLIVWSFRRYKVL